MSVEGLEYENIVQNGPKKVSSTFSSFYGLIEQDPALIF